MSRKQDEEDEKEAAREREAREKEAAAKRKTSKEAEPAPGPTIVGGLPPEDYLTQQEKAARDGKPYAPTDEDVAKAEKAKAKKE